MRFDQDFPCAARGRADPGRRERELIRPGDGPECEVGESALSKNRSTVGTPATVALVKATVDHTIRAYDHDPAARDRGLSYGLEAARALGLDPRTVFKTLVAEIDGALTVAVIPVDSQLDLKALATAGRGKRAAMADPAAAERATGYVLGGISPLGQRRRLPTVIDSTAVDHPTVLVSAGRRGVDVELAPADLIRLTSAITAPIARR